jgi:hypothetical protein
MGNGFLTAVDPGILDAQFDFSERGGLTKDEKKLLFLENVRGCFLPLHRLYLINAEPLS